MDQYVSVALDIYFLVALLLYFLFLYTLIKHGRTRELNSPFYKFVISLGVGDVLTILNNLFARIVRQFGVFVWMRDSGYGWHANNFLARAIIFNIAAGNFSHNIALLLIALNRFTAICFPVYSARVRRE